MNEFILSAMANKVAWRASCSREELERALAGERFLEISQRVLEATDVDQQSSSVESRDKYTPTKSDKVCEGEQFKER